MKKRILITGGAGFLGSHLADRALLEGFEVIIFDNLSSGEKRQGSFTFIEGDVNNAAELRALEPVDIVIHCAAMCGVERALANSDQVIEDFQGTRNICEYARKKKVKHLVFFSTGEIYGNRAINAREEDDVCLWNTHQPRTNYALSKLMGEAQVRTQPMRNTIIRPFNVFGARQNGQGVVRNFFYRAIRNQPLEIYNSGKELRAMCYIDDFIEGCFRAILAENQNQVFNLGNPANAMTVEEIAETVLRVTESESPVNYIPKDYPDKAGVTPSIDRAKKILGFSPRFSLEQGVKKMMYEKDRQQVSP